MLSQKNMFANKFKIQLIELAGLLQKKAILLLLLTPFVLSCAEEEEEKKNVTNTGGNSNPTAYIKKLDPGVYVSTLVGSVTAGDAIGDEKATKFSGPSVVVFDDKMNIYITDSGNNRIKQGIPKYVDGLLKYHVQNLAGDGTAGNVLNKEGIKARFNGVSGMAYVTYGGKNFLIVADQGNHQIKKVEIGGDYEVSLLAGSTQGNNDGAASQAQFNNPNAVVANDTHVYVADTANSAIRKIALSDGTVETVFNGYGTGDNKLNFPRGLALDSSNNIIISDTRNHIIKRIDLTTTTKVPETLFGQTKGGNVDGAVADALLAGPTGLAIDKENRVYIADTHNNTIRLYDPATQMVSTLAGSEIGYKDTTPAEGPRKSKFSNPVGLSVTADGSKIFVADTNNNLIRLIETVPGEAASTTK